MRRSQKIERHTLDKKQVKGIIDLAAERGVQALSFTGGEPLLFLDDLIELIDHACHAGISFVRTGTNGFIFGDAHSPGFTRRIETIARKLAGTGLYTFWISIDSADPRQHEEIRGLPGIVEGIRKALPIFHKYGIYPAANLGINRATGGAASRIFLSDTTEEHFLTTYKNAFSRFYRFACDLGFTTVNACYPMSEQRDETHELDRSPSASLYGAASGDDLISFSEREKALIFQALFEIIPKFRGQIRIFTPRCTLHGLIKKYSAAQQMLFPCRGGHDFFFVSCENGTVSPCGYRNEPLGTLPNLKKHALPTSNCDLCEWECFRDPSDVLAPFAMVFTTPVQLLRKMIKDPRFFQILLTDLNYYRACGFFNGRRAPRRQALKRFER